MFTRRIGEKNLLSGSVQAKVLNEPLRSTHTAVEVYGCYLNEFWYALCLTPCASAASRLDHLFSSRL